MFLEAEAQRCKLCNAHISEERAKTATYNQICSRCVKIINDKVRYHNNRARKAGVVGRLTSADWYALLLDTNFSCASCGALHTPESPLELDHIIPMSLGGANFKFNIQPLCNSCHKTKDRAKQHSPLVTKKIGSRKFYKNLVAQQKAQDETYLNEARAVWLMEGKEGSFTSFLREYTLMKWLEDRMGRCRTILI